MEERELIIKKDEMNKLILKTQTVKKRIISLQIQARAEIYLLTTLHSAYPQSEEIPRRLQICNEMINKGTEHLVEIATQLTRYEAQITRINNLLEDSVHLTVSPR